MTSNKANIDEIKLELPFKGEREYIHGTDLFDSLLKHTGARGPLELRINEAMRDPVNVVPQHCSRGKEKPSGIFVCDSGHFNLFQDSSRKVESKIPYDENLVVEGFEMNNSSIVLETPTGYSVIERTVALNKLMLRKLHGDSTRWLFTRLVLDSVPDASAAIRIELRQQIGTRIVKSALFFDQHELGEIYFSGSVA